MRKGTCDKDREFFSNVALQLKGLRKHRKITQEELGGRIGKDKTQISKIEKGTRNLTIDTILNIVKALDAEVTITIKIKT